MNERIYEKGSGGEYLVVSSGDPETPWELVAPDGRTVAICQTKAEARSFVVSDRYERARGLI